MKNANPLQGRRKAETMTTSTPIAEDLTGSGPDAPAGGGERADLLAMLAERRHFLRFTARDLSDDQAGGKRLGQRLRQRLRQRLGRRGGGEGAVRPAGRRVAFRATGIWSRQPFFSELNFPVEAHKRGAIPVFG